MAEYLYIIKTIEDNKIQLATKVDIVDGVMMTDNKICAVLKRYETPVDMTEVMANLSRFSAVAPAAAQPAAEAPAQAETPPAPAPEPAPQPEPETSALVIDRHLSDYKR